MDKAKRNDIHRRFVYLSSDDVSRERSFACGVLMGRFHELAMMVEECARDCREKSLALTALEEGDNYPCALNGAGEVAVQAFLRGEIAFVQIAEVIARALEETERCQVTDYAVLEETDKWARLAAKRVIEVL